jgi:selenocysteine lyase/cysteine desulfurase
VPVLLDAYQAIGSLPIDVKALGVDFLAAGVLKYLLGSAGLAFLYCRRELWESAWPTATGWFADRNVFEMDIHDYSPAPDARRFQSGTPPVPSIYAGIAGIELMQDIGVAATRKHVRRLTELLIEGVDDLGGSVATPRNPSERGALVCIRSTDAERLVGELDKEGIVTSSRDGNLRVSPHAYNTPEDIKTVLWELGRRRELLA